MPKSKTSTKPQKIKTIRNYIKQGYSANKIQKILQKQNMGMQRKVLLGEIRKIKGQKPKADRFKYTPKKYRSHTREQAYHRIATGFSFIGKHIAVYRYARTKRHPRAYSARFEFYGSGKDLANAVMLTFSGVVPRKEWAFVECSARDFLKNPYYYGERGFWVGKPNVES